MNKILKMGIGILAAVMLYGCTSAEAAYAPEVETTVAETTVTTESTIATSTTEVTTSTSATTTSISGTSATTSITETTLVIEPTENFSTVTESSETITVAEIKTETTIKVESEIPAPTQARVYTVYKPSTHYIHKSTCHWVDSTCYEIETTDGLECRKCSECNPDLEIITPYIEPTPVVATTNTGISDGDYVLLCKIVANEYGGMTDVRERAKIVASVMNQVNDSRFPNTVEGALDKSCAPWGFNKYNNYFCGGSIHYSTMSDAVDYYFNNPAEFASWTCNSWWGDGTWNHFYTA